MVAGRWHVEESIARHCRRIDTAASAGSVNYRGDRDQGSRPYSYAWGRDGGNELRRATVISRPPLMKFAVRRAGGLTVAQCFELGRWKENETKLGDVLPKSSSRGCVGQEQRTEASRTSGLERCRRKID